MNKGFRILTAFGLLTIIVGCGNPPSETGKSSKEISAEQEPQMDTLRLALDWKPNVLHSGIFLAEARGWYRENNLYIDWFTPEVDNYTKKPLKRVLDGEADLSIGPSEHLFFYALDSVGKPKAQAIASLLQQDMSAFVTKKESGISTPAQMDGKKYLGYHTPMEEEVLSSMIRNDGGKGNFESTHPDRLKVWEAFMQDKGDMAWVFVHWEAVLARQKGVEVNEFIPNDYGVPYGYSSVIMAPVEIQKDKQKLIRKFLEISKRGYKEAAEKPSKVAEKLVSYIDHSNFSKLDFIQAAQDRISPAYFDSNGNWGKMDKDKWRAFMEWMDDNGLIKGGMELPVPESFYTNTFLN